MQSCLSPCHDFGFTPYKYRQRTRDPFFSRRLFGCTLMPRRGGAEAERVYRHGVRMSGAHPGEPFMWLAVSRVMETSLNDHTRLPGLAEQIL